MMQQLYKIVNAINIFGRPVSSLKGKTVTLRYERTERAERQISP